MKRDIDKIIEAVKRQIPHLVVVQMHKVFPADDDGLWWFRIPGRKKDIQAESATGNCPFIVESDDTHTAVDAITARSVEQVVDLVVSYLSSPES